MIWNNFYNLPHPLHPKWNFYFCLLWQIRKYTVELTMKILLWLNNSFFNVTCYFVFSWNLYENIHCFYLISLKGKVMNIFEFYGSLVLDRSNAYKRLLVDLYRCLDHITFRSSMTSKIEGSFSDLNTKLPRKVVKKIAKCNIRQSLQKETKILIIRKLAKFHFL